MTNDQKPEELEGTDKPSLSLDEEAPTLYFNPPGTMYELDVTKMTTLQEVIDVLAILTISVYDDDSDKFAGIRHLYKEPYRGPERADDDSDMAGATPSESEGGEGGARDPGTGDSPDQDRRGSGEGGS